MARSSHPIRLFALLPSARRCDSAIRSTLPARAFLLLCHRLSPWEAASPLPSALERVERHATSACVQRCLDFLPDNYRGVLLLHKAHGLSAAEIADLLQVSVGSVKIRLHRARKRLEKVMQAGCRVSETGQGIPCCAPKPGDISRLRSALAGDVRAGRRM